MLTPVGLEILRNLTIAWAAGMLVGLERTYNGRSAGFRTHALVSLAAAAVAVICFQPLLTLAGGDPGAHRLDPSRFAQGVVTGVGFLGAGVIFKEGLNIQGLTTAASVWATATVGLLCGFGMIYAGIAVTLMILATLLILRWIEGVVPWRVYAVATFRFEADKAPDEKTLVNLLGDHCVRVADASYKLLNGGRTFEYLANVETRRQSAFVELADRLRTIPGLVEYEVYRVSK